jgi:thiamine-phosphate pyrophosphorylase
MAHSHSMKSQASAPRLYLVTPPLSDAAAFSRDLATALESADVAAVLLRLAEADERAKINCIKTLAPVVQGKNIALLIDGHADLVARGGADGAHLTGIEVFSAALETLKPARIAGCSALATRHDAMVAAESGADYVMFGDALHGRRPVLGAILERVGWWAELFEVPCVGWAESLDEVSALAASGADFVAIGDYVWAEPAGVAAAIHAAAAKLAAPEPVA